jgi:hypothetical protein
LAQVVAVVVDLDSPPAAAALAEQAVVVALMRVPFTI